MYSQYTFFGFKKTSGENAASKFIMSANFKDSTLKASFLGTAISATMPKEEQNSFLANYQCYLPEAVKNSKKPKLNFLSRIGKPKLFIKNNMVSISSTADRGWLSIDTILSISKFLEKDLNNRGIFSIHAAGIALKDRGCLIIGETGSGKTTTAIKSCIDGREFGIISGNRIFLNKNRIIGGAKFLRVRVGSLISELNFRKNKLLRILGTGSLESMNGKITTTPRELGINEFRRKSAKLVAIFKVKKLPGKFSASISRGESIEKFESIYKALSEFSDYFPDIMYSARLPYPDIFGQKLRLQRVLKARELINNIPLITVEGDIDDISKYIIQSMRRQKFY